MTCGPLTESEHKGIILQLKKKDKSSVESMLSKFDFPLSTTVPHNSTVFIDNKSKKLFLVSPLTNM